MARLFRIEPYKALNGACDPALKDDLVKTAESNGANDDITTKLPGLDDDHFTTPARVTEAVSFASKKNS